MPPRALAREPARTPSPLPCSRGERNRRRLRSFELAELEIRNLHVSVEDKEILKGLDLDVEKGKIHALMGPNGSGKSTLANAIMGHPALEVTEGTITFKGTDITEADPDERSRMGLFMAFQYPVAIPGVTVAKYLRMAINAHREARGEDPGQAQGLPQDDRGGDGADQHPEGLLLALRQRRLLGRREEADGGAAARAAAPRDRGPRRDRLRAGHRRAQGRRRGRQQLRRPRHGRADHHPLPAHPAPDQARRRARPLRRAHRQGGRPRAGRPARVRRATAGSTTRSRPRRSRGPCMDVDGHSPRAPPLAGRRSAPSSRSSSARGRTASRWPTSTTAPPRRSRSP